MLIFNCTKAAADFFTVTRKGVKQSPLQPKPPIPINQPNTPEQPLSSWLVHVIKVQRKNIVIAMHIEHRYAMVFCGLKKGDWQGFTTQLIERLFNNMQFFGEAFDLCDEVSFHAMLDRFISDHDQPYFCQRGDPSTQSHLNDVVWHFENKAHQSGTLPVGRQEGFFDKFVNHLIRTAKHRPKHFFPDQEMFTEWISRYSEHNDIQHVIGDAFKHLRRHGFEPKPNIDIDEALASIQKNIADSHATPPLDSASLPDNVICFASAKNKRKH